MTPTDTDRQNLLARNVIRELLGGNPPNSTRPEDCGGWAGDVAALYGAHAEGGTEAVKMAYNALAEATPALFTLVSSNPEQRKTRWTAAELLSTEFPEPKWTVPDLIPEGLVTLAGRPKLGKSWLALQLAHAVATGGKVLSRDAGKGKVLFLAYEDSERRLKGRMEKQGVPALENLIFELEWPTLQAGGYTDLQSEIQGGGYSLLIIDTLTRALGREDQNDLAEMSVIIGNLQRLAQREQITILTLDHHRKPSGMIADPIDDIIGSTGKAAVVDVALGMYKGKGKRETTLKATGRDIEEVELALEFDGLTGCWQALGEAGEVRKDTLQADILTAIEDLVEMGEVPNTTAIAQHLGKNKGNVSRELAELLRKGAVVKGPKEGAKVPYLLPSQGVNIP